MSSNNNSLITKNFNGTNVRIIDVDGESWWVAKDPCDVLGLSNVSAALQSLDDDEVTQVDPKKYLGSENHSNQLVNVISEAGLYKLIMRSRKPVAKKFQRWVTHEVLPSIRKHGAYMTEETLNKALTSPDFLIQLATQLKESQERVKAQQAQLDAQAPKVLFADSYSASGKNILIGELAKFLKQNGVEWAGQNRLFDWMKANGYLMKGNGRSKNAPTQKSMELGLFKRKTTDITHSDGHVTVSFTTLVTPRGQAYFINKFLGKGALNA